MRLDFPAENYKMAPGEMCQSGIRTLELEAKGGIIKCTAADQMDLDCVQ